MQHESAPGGALFDEVLMIIDAHEDIACGILSCGRDYLRPVAQTRELEKKTPHIPEGFGDSLLGWAEYQQGQVGVVFCTLFASPRRWLRFDWDTQSFATPDEAHEMNLIQIDAYHRLAGDHSDAFQMINCQQDLEKVVSAWQQTPAHYPEVTHPVGLVILMEGADGVRSKEDLDKFWERGVRIIGPTWAGNRFCGGTREPGPLTAEGKMLLKQMAQVGFTLDISHMSHASAREALDLYEGQVIASHANAKALLGSSPSERHLEDAAIRSLVERDGVMGVIPFNFFLDSEWRSGAPRELVTLERLALHIDHICQIAGNSKHAGIGSDFDGGFGLQDVPIEINSIADLPLIGELLSQKGYNDGDVMNIMSGNWQRMLQATLPD